MCGSGGVVLPWTAVQALRRDIVDIPAPAIKGLRPVEGDAWDKRDGTVRPRE
jgi:hypothetical protein